MKKIFFALATISAALILSLGSTASASAQTPQAPTAPAGVSAAANDVEVQQSCRARFSQGVNHRASASAGSTSLGIVPANTWVPAACSLTTGGSYTACGTTSNQWLRVYWNGRWGYSAWACLANWEYV
jgi:hypothetical protein